MAQRIYDNHQKIAETQVYQEKHQIEAKALLYIRLRLFLIQKCLSTVNFLQIFNRDKVKINFAIIAYNAKILK